MPTREFIADVLTHCRFSELIGRHEDLWFEAKQNHELNLSENPRHRFELAKDVSAFANGEGGFLLFGLTTEPVAEAQTDRVTGLDLLVPTDFDTAQFAGVVAEYVHPKIRGLQVARIESTETEGRYLGCITIPPQSRYDQPFLMKAVFEEEIEIQQIVFGIARRVGSSNKPTTIEELYRAVLQGKASVPERLTRIENILAEIVTRLEAGGTSRAVPATDRLLDRINRVLPK